ncbi:hypothetical protein ABH924_003615 [Arthrobacter sp. GAS37]|uniref:ricin-type beta-trefoil lectin domain protein n=1 Tax=Arthrobacter sp. GAS37 TaxID=3156261 RepID=UPI0038379DBC
MGAPLVVSTDLRKLAANPTDPHFAQSIATLKNNDIISVDQDTLGAGGYLASSNSSDAASGIDVVVKPLANGDRAVVVLNKNSTTSTYNLDLGRVGYGNLQCARTVKDLWSHASSTATTQIPLTIGAHDNAMLTISPANCGAAVPTGQIAATQSATCLPPLCLDAWQGGTTAGTPIGTYNCTGNTNQQWVRNQDRTVRLYGTAQCISRTAPGSTSTIGGQTGTFAVLEPCNAADTKQQIGYNRNGQMTTADGQCLDIYGGNQGTSGLPVDWYGCGTSQTNQLFATSFAAPPAP